MNTQVFFQAQLNEIQRYLQLYPTLDSNYLANEWIESNAANFRRAWENDCQFLVIYPYRK